MFRSCSCLCEAVMMYRRILVLLPIGSETSSIAIEHAEQLAKDQRARLRIVHVVESIGHCRWIAGSAAYPFDPTPLWEAMREDGRKALSMAEAKAVSAGVGTETALLEDKEPPERVASILARDAQRWDADLIVIGTHGRRGIDRLLVGSVAETLARMAPTGAARARQDTCSGQKHFLTANASQRTGFASDQRGVLSCRAISDATRL